LPKTEAVEERAFLEDLLIFWRMFRLLFRKVGDVRHRQ
jgi:hypothetical protein